MIEKFGTEYVAEIERERAERGARVKASRAAVKAKKAAAAAKEAGEGAGTDTDDTIPIGDTLGDDGPEDQATGNQDDDE